MSRDGPDRRLRLVDGMVLISIAALGLAMASGPYRGLDPEMLIVVGGGEYRGWILAKYYGALVFPLITPLTLALPILGLRYYGRIRGAVLLRPDLGDCGAAPKSAIQNPKSEVFLRTGLGGCVAASVALVLRGLEYLPFYLRNAAWHLGPIDPWVVTGEKVGYAVLGFWAALAVAGRSRFGPGWPERLGIAVSALWMAGAVGAVAVVLRIRGGEFITSRHWFH